MGASGLADETLFASRSGREGAPVLVLLHGFAGDGSVWDAVRTRLEDGFEVIVYDLPGHGRSLAHPGIGAPKSAAAILGDLIARDRRPFHLAGHSMGGAIAALMAIEAPDRVLSLTLVAPGGFGEEIDHALLLRHAVSRSAEKLRTTFNAMRGPNAPVDDAAVQHAVQFRAVPGQREALRAIGERLARDGRQGVIPREKLAALSMPVSVVWGTEDRVLPATQASGLPTGFDVRLIEGAGHMLPEEQPAVVAGMIARIAS